MKNPSTIKSIAHAHFNDKNLDNVRFVKVNSMPALPEHLTAKNYVYQTISNRVDGSSLLRLDPDEELKIEEQDSINLKSSLTSPKTIIEIPTKSYVDSLSEKIRNRRYFSTVFNDQDKEFDNNKLTKLDSITVIRDPTTDNKL